MSAFIDMSAAATGNAECQLSLNKILIDTLGGAVRKVLRTCAVKINDNFDQLTTITNHDDRFIAIVQLFGLEDEDTVKIILPPKKTADPTKKNTTKSKAEKKIPVPFWGKQTVKPELCQGLMAGLYNQCTGKPKTGCIYCTKCQKDADANGGIPKRGNIELRMEQFSDSFYEYTPPGGKLKKIYYYQHVLKNNFTAEDIDDMLREKGIKLNTEGKRNLIFIPEKKTRGTKEKNLTDDMEKPKTSKKKKPEPQPEPEDEDEDDDENETASVCSQSTIATDQTGITIGDQTDFDDDDDVPYASDGDDDSQPEPVKKPEPETIPDDSDGDDDSQPEPAQFRMVSDSEGARPVKKPEPAQFRLGSDSEGARPVKKPEPEKKKKVTIPDNVSSFSMKDVDVENVPKPKKSALKKKNDQEPVVNDDDEIDITLFKTAKLGGIMYAISRNADMNENVELYEVKDFVSKTEWKIVSLKAVGTFNFNTKKIKKF